MRFHSRKEGRKDEVGRAWIYFRHGPASHWFEAYTGIFDRDDRYWDALVTTTELLKFLYPIKTEGYKKPLDRPLEYW